MGDDDIDAFDAETFDAQDFLPENTPRRNTPEVDAWLEEELPAVPHDRKLWPITLH